MSFGFSIGDFIAVGTLLRKANDRFKDAPVELQNLQGLIVSIQCCIESARETVEDIWTELPIVHKASIANALDGVKHITQQIVADIDRYSYSLRSRVRFAWSESPRDIESKLTMHMTVLNTVISVIVCDSVTSRAMPQYDARNLASKIRPATGTVMPSRSSPAPEASTAARWSNASSSNTKLLARGFYNYGRRAEPGKTVPAIDTVNYELRIAGNRLYGAAEDSLGCAAIEGTFDAVNGTANLRKTYTFAIDKTKNGVQWEYSGTFTPCGLVGEWHYPGDPVALAHHRGNFGMWLLGDEVEGSEAQIAMLAKNGKVLSRSLTRA